MGVKGDIMCIVKRCHSVSFYCTFYFTTLTNSLRYRMTIILYYSSELKLLLLVVQRTKSKTS